VDSTRTPTLAGWIERGGSRRALALCGTALLGGGWCGAHIASQATEAWPLWLVSLATASLLLGLCCARGTWVWMCLLLATAALACARAVDATDRWLPSSSATMVGPGLGQQGPMEQARLGQAWWTVPEGSLGTGDRVVLVAQPAVERWAEGPVPGPRSQSPQPERIEPPVEALVRVEAGGTALGAAVRSAATAVRAALLERCDAIAHLDARGLVAALLLGDVMRLRDEVPPLFKRTGTYHVLAVSGFQVALLAALLVLPLARLVSWLVQLSLRRELPPEPLALVALLVFVALVGGGAPIVRAAACFAFGLIAARLRPAQPVLVHGGTVWLERRVDALSVWWLALILEVLLRPQAPVSLSVQLSFGATLGLLLGTRCASASVRGWWGEPAATTAPPVALVLWRRALGVAATAIGASIAATLATLPFLWTLEQEWAPIGIVATPLVFLPMCLLLLYGWVWIALPFLPEAPLHWAAEAMLLLLQACDALPGSPCALPARPLWLIALTVGCTLAAMALQASATRQQAARAAALLWVVLLVPWTAAPRAVEVHALAVGAGSCTVVRGPALGVWIIDAGSRDRRAVAQEALAPLLAAWESTEIHTIATHGDRDHDGALPWVGAHRLPQLHAGHLSKELDRALTATTRHIDTTTGAVRVVQPTRENGRCELWLERGLDREGNEGSRFVRLRTPSQTLLVCGDAEAEGLEAWLEQTPREAVDLLVWPHHGADFLLAQRLLSSVQPAEVWFSSSLERPPAVHALGAQVWRSTASGPLQLTWELDGCEP